MNTENNRNRTNNQISRRGFLEVGSAVTGVAGVLAMTGIASAQELVPGVKTGKTTHINGSRSHRQALGCGLPPAASANCIGTRRRNGPSCSMAAQELPPLTTRAAASYAGIHNAESFAVDSSGRLFVTQHGRDQMHANWPDFYTPDQEVMFRGSEGLRSNKQCGAQVEVY